MCNFSVQFNPAIVYNADRKNWEFTGKIKYVKYTHVTEVYFEVLFIIPKDRHRNILARLKGKPQEQEFITETEYFNEKDFYFREIPEVTITQCK